MCLSARCGALNCARETLCFEVLVHLSHQGVFPLRVYMKHVDVTCLSTSCKWYCAYFEEIFLYISVVQHFRSAGGHAVWHKMLSRSTVEDALVTTWVWKLWQVVDTCLSTAGIHKCMWQMVRCHVCHCNPAWWHTTIMTVALELMFASGCRHAVLICVLRVLLNSSHVGEVWTSRYVCCQWTEGFSSWWDVCRTTLNTLSNVLFLVLCSTKTFAKSSNQASCWSSMPSMSCHICWSGCHLFLLNVAFCAAMATFEDENGKEMLDETRDFMKTCKGVRNVCVCMVVLCI